MTDLEDPANNLLTDQPPSAEPEPPGPETVREQPEPGAGLPLASLPNAPTNEPRASSAVLAVCSCGAEITDGAPHCKTCGRFTPYNLDALVTGLRSKKLAKIVDAYRVDLIEQLFAERGGREALDVVSRIAIENYALVCAQHKTIEARLDQDGLFTQTGRRRSAFDMLKAISETIDRLRAELPPPVTRSTSTAGADAMPISALEAGRDLLQRLVAGETLTEFEHGQLTVLRASMRGEVLLPPDPALERTIVPNTRDGSYPRDAGPPVLATVEPTEARPALTLVPAPQTCIYCGQTPCIGPDHHAFDVLHRDDPEHVEARHKRETTEMIESLRRQRLGFRGPQW